MVTSKSRRTHRKRPRYRRIIDTAKLLRRRKKGEVLRVSKLLVCVKGCYQPVPDGFNEIESVDTRLLERWKEYVVVARSTGKPDTPVKLQFYDSRNIDKIETGSRRSKSKLTIMLGQTYEASLYSTLDKSIALYKRSIETTATETDGSKKKGHPRGGGLNKIYIFQSRSSQNALEWMLFLNSFVGLVRRDVLTLGIPDLKITATMPLHEVRALARQQSPQLVPYSEMTSFMSSPSLLTAKVLQGAIEAITGVDSLREFVDRNWKNVKLGLAWRRYDRLEWLYDVREAQIHTSWAMSLSHDLELRAKTSYSLDLQLEDGSTVSEPTPIEGFLIRRNSWSSGTHARKFFYRKSYLHVHDNLLFTCRAARAIPPYPDQGQGQGQGPEELDIEAIAESMPILYDVAPYRVDEVSGKIEWIGPGLTEKKFEAHDRAALYELQRRVACVERSTNFIDLAEVEQVTPVGFSTSEDGGEEGACFEILLAHGGVLTLEAANEFTRDTWVERLSELVRYWKLRATEAINRTHDIREQNLRLLQIDDDMDAFVGEAVPKWETERGITDPLQYNLSGLSWSRSLHMKGVLFQKPSKHASFRKYYALLCHGDLILYSPYARGATGAIKPRSSYERYQSISLHDCYLYSGTISSADLLKRDKWFDNTNPGHHALPRVYPDGWKSAEDESLRCFVLWFARKKLRSNLRQNHRDDEVDILAQPPGVRVVNRLGVGGVSMVFMTRSRQERDQWVLALKSEIASLTDSYVDFNVK